ncbi:unnamed protein product [Alopecurus aequalis]
MASAVVALVVVLLTWLLTAAMHKLAWRPYGVQKAFRLQGIRGPAFRLWVGNKEEVRAMREASSNDVLDLGSHDIVRRVQPELQAWTAKYGKVFLWWSGHTPVLCVADHDMAKQILSDKKGVYDQDSPGSSFLALVGNGLVFVNGDDWARHRRVVHLALAMGRLKMMAGTMAECAREVVGSWEAGATAARGGVARVENAEQHFRELSAQVISRTTFGKDGKEFVMAQLQLQHMALASFNDFHLPLGLDEYLPTQTNIQRWRLTKKVRRTLTGIIRDRGAGGSYGDDLLGLMLHANASAGAGKLSMEEIMDECKTLLLAGRDSTSHLLTWAVFLLGTHPEWQHKLRDEVLRECGASGTPHGDALNKLKLTTMLLHETLRLYGAATLLTRTATADTELCGVKIPKGTTMMIPIAMMHRDEQVWGADAGEFNPERFRDGVGRAASHTTAMLAFSAGPRSCIGQDFAMLVAKATLALLLRRFHFTVAPEYVHAPDQFLTLQPKCGLPILLNLIS